MGPAKEFRADAAMAAACMVAGDLVVNPTAYAKDQKGALAQAGIASVLLDLMGRILVTCGLLQCHWLIIW